MCERHHFRIGCMIVILAIDALEYSLVERFNCSNLKQKYYGKTDISEFSEPRTMVLWSSFLAGKNMEHRILSMGNIAMWSFKMDISETFLRQFKNPAIIDLPGFSYDLELHRREREMLKKFFEVQNQEKKDAIRKEYNNNAFEHHRMIKNLFDEALKKENDLVLAYFSIADVIGHLNFGNRGLMRMIYRDLDEIAGRIPSPKLVLSDHGMKEVGIFGDHSNYGFWSTGSKDLENPKITEFSNIIPNLRTLTD